jgi:hypothetical protein
VVAVELGQRGKAVGRLAALAAGVAVPNSSLPSLMTPSPLRSRASKPSPEPTQPVLTFLPSARMSNCTPAPMPSV